MIFFNRNYLLNSPVPQYSHIRIMASAYEFLGHTSQLITGVYSY